MLESSIPLGRVLGIRVGVHYTWFIIFALVSFTLSRHFHELHPDWGVATLWLTALVTALLFFASILLHELGHSVVAIRRGIPVHSITLFIFGGMAQTKRDADTARTEFWVAIAGPLVSLALAGLFYLLSDLLTPYAEEVGLACDWLASINLMVALFNLLPGFPLDGGRVFRALVWGITGDGIKGMYWAVNAGKAVAYGLMGLGFVTVVTTGLLVNGLWLALIGWFLLQAAEASGRQYMLNRLSANVRAENVMQVDVPVVPDSLSVQQWIDDYVLAKAQRAFLVRDDGRIIGLISLSDCNKVAREQWPSTGITAIMTPREKLLSVLPQTDLMLVLEMMDNYSLNQIPVMQREQVMGWIDRDRLLKALRIHEEVGR